MITKLASCLFQLICLSTVVVGVVIIPVPFTGFGVHSFHFSYVVHSTWMYRDTKQNIIISQRSTCKFSTKNTAMALSHFPQAIVFGICGNFVVWCRLWMVDGPSSLTLVLTFAEPAIVFILLEFRELEEFGVLKVPDGLSELS